MTISGHNNVVIAKNNKIIILLGSLKGIFKKHFTSIIYLILIGLSL
jgi:hypothetical protein